jgi:hypothetical protein
MANVTTRSTTRNAAVHARVSMINGRFDLPERTPPALNLVREAVADAAEKVTSAVEGAETHDTGRLIAALDLLQQAKNVACDALILPHAPKQ